MTCYKLLSVHKKESLECNIGDYIQALAASQFLPRIDGFVNREELKDYQGVDCSIVMNGWFIHDVSQWPPSNKINPLFISIHFNSTAVSHLLSDRSISYLKQYEPIGCRDIGTRDLLISKGINAYFSGCLTLTLGYKYKSLSRFENVYFVDPYFVTNWNVKMFLKNTIELITHYTAISRIAAKYPEKKTGIKKKLILSTFFREYRKYFAEETLINATYICQQSCYYEQNFSSDYERLKEAERIVKLYAQASLVITSRIHCALPCLGLETPVIFTENCQQSVASSCRLQGLRDLFNILYWKEDRLVANFEYSYPIKTVINKSGYEELAKSLINKCKNWVINN